MEKSDVVQSRSSTFWGLAFGVLSLGWIAGLILQNNNVSGPLSSYLTDLFFPGWVYIIFRGLWKNNPLKPGRIGGFFGITPDRAAFSIFLFGAITECSTIYWPHGIFSGVFDIYDIAAYGVSLFACYVFDRRRKDGN
jgi:hypothetical protein